MTRKELLKELESCGVKVDRPDLENDELQDLLDTLVGDKEEIQKFCAEDDAPPPFPYEEEELTGMTSLGMTGNPKDILLDEDLLINRHLGIEEEISEFEMVGERCTVKNIFRNINELIGEEREYYAGFFFKMGMKYEGCKIHYFRELETYCIYVGDIEEAEKLTVKLLEEHFKG